MQKQEHARYVGILEMSDEEFQAFASELAWVVVRYGAMFLLSFGGICWTLGFRLP